MSIPDGKIKDNHIMITATRIKMKPGCTTATSVLEIADIYLVGVPREGFYSKADVHDFVKAGNIVRVNISPYPKLIAETSIFGEKFVKSEPNGIYRDNLLQLPRE